MIKGYFKGGVFLIKNCFYNKSMLSIKKQSSLSYYLSIYLLIEKL